MRVKAADIQHNPDFAGLRVHFFAAAVLSQLIGEDIDDGGLACPGRPQQAKDLALFYMEAYI